MMKKNILTLSFILMFVLLTACGKNTNKVTESETQTAPATTATTAAQETTASTTKATTASEVKLTIADYFPFRENTEYIYEGKGNEYASYNVMTDYIKDNSIQLRTNNGGTELAEVLQYKDGALTKVLTRGEAYYRENLIGKTEGKSEILLKEPLVKGTEWTLADNRKRYVSNVNVAIETPYGNFKALEVTTEGKNDTIKDYYALDVGLVKTIFSSSGTEVSSSLSDVKENVPFTQTIRFFYPNVDKNVIYYEDRQVSFKTNDITKDKLSSSIKNLTREEFNQVLSKNTKINSLYLDKDNKVHVDFSKELTGEMNAGSGYEGMILQCITNTLGNYYVTNDVIITVDNKPYESGHILMRPGESFKVKMDNVVGQ
jgi:hypothetical protein